MNKAFLLEYRTAFASHFQRQAVRKLFLHLGTEAGPGHGQVHSLAFKQDENDPTLLTRLTTELIEESPQIICKMTKSKQ